MSEWVNGKKKQLATLTDTYANQPGNVNEGNLFFPSDGFVVERDTGAAWVPWGPIYPLAAPPTTGWSWVNQGPASVDAAKGGIYLETTGNAAVQYHLYVRSQPTKPYVMTTAFMTNGSWLNNVSHVWAVVWRQSSDGKLVTLNFDISQTGNAFQISKWTDHGTFSAHYLSRVMVSIQGMSRVLFVRIEDNNTNRIVSLSADGQHWIQHHSVGNTDFLTADQVGISVRASHAADTAGMTLISWKEE